jgi:V/A-type H+/Na+-transporting ATPase subunit A
MRDPRIVRVSGALCEALGLAQASLYELVQVGTRGLLGEVIRLDGDHGVIQVYEDTTGLRVGEPVKLTGSALTVHLGPGLLGNILDGVGRPLSAIAAQSGDFVEPGIAADTLDPARRWRFQPVVEPGVELTGGDVLGTVEERPGMLHRIMLPPARSGRLARLAAGDYTVLEPIGELDDGTPLHLAQAWPVRQPRPGAERLPAERPFVTGQRVFDFLFPVSEGGSVAVPGGFGTGKTVIEQALAKYAEADIVVYIGCGERGNEMAEVLTEFPRLVDPRTGRSIMDRSVLVVNTSNMPVAARESSVYLGITIAEYYRDMGHRVAVMADSLSRWGEALREIAARLQEMPGEEGYPTYLGNRLGKFYERAGRVRALGRPERDGVLTLISAVSPPGGDFSEPVTQASLRVAGALWALDPALAHQRQFPAVDWETSYSLHAESTAPWFAEHAGPEWPALRRETLELLQRERELREIAGLIGPEALQDRDRLLLEAAKLVRETVLGQSAFDPNDALSPVEKTYRLALLARNAYQAGLTALDQGAVFDRLNLAPVRRALTAVRWSPPASLEIRLAEADRAVRQISPGASA